MVGATGAPDGEEERHSVVEEVAERSAVAHSLANAGALVEARGAVVGRPVRQHKGPMAHDVNQKALLKEPNASDCVDKMVRPVSGRPRLDERIPWSGRGQRPGAIEADVGAHDAAIAIDDGDRAAIVSHMSCAALTQATIRPQARTHAGEFRQDRWPRMLRDRARFAFADLAGLDGRARGDQSDILGSRDQASGTRSSKTFAPPSLPSFELERVPPRRRVRKRCV